MEILCLEQDWNQHFMPFRPCVLTITLSRLLDTITPPIRAHLSLWLLVRAVSTDDYTNHYPTYAPSCNHPTHAHLSMWVLAREVNADYYSNHYTI